MKKPNDILKFQFWRRPTNSYREHKQWQWKNHEKNLLSNLTFKKKKNLYKDTPFTIWFSKGNWQWWCYFLFLLRQLCSNTSSRDRLLVFLLNAFFLPHFVFRCQKLFERSIGEYNCSTCRGKLSFDVPKRYE